MEKACFRDIIERTLSIKQFQKKKTTTKNTSILNSNNSRVVAQDTNLLELQYGRDLYSEEDFYTQDYLKYKYNHIKPNNQNKKEDLMTDLHLSHAFWYALVDLRTVNSHLPHMSPSPIITLKTTKLSKANWSQWRPNLTIAPGKTKRTHKVSPTINKLTIEQYTPNAIFSDGLRGIKHRCPYRHGFFVKCHSGRRLAQRSDTGSTYITKLRLSAWVPNYDCQRTNRSTCCNSWIAIQSRWHYVQSKIYSLNKPHKPFHCFSIPTTQQSNTRYVTRNAEFSFLFNAILKRKSDIFIRIWPDTKPSRNFTLTR